MPTLYNSAVCNKPCSLESISTSPLVSITPHKGSITSEITSNAKHAINIIYFLAYNKKFKLKAFKSSNELNNQPIGKINTQKWIN